VVKVQVAEVELVVPREGGAGRDFEVGHGGYVRTLLLSC
jgi:hypothetical protein